ncbi:MAG TPA: choice-of-anchor Q domain-containing protein, partial [Thermomicrobiales bacterium]|nr:choice-of-anchor Q domain-containing protein [Thermomicrobiales bacterium]
ILTGNPGGGDPDSQITITSSTIADNSAPSGSGIYVVGGYFDLENTIVANDLSDTTTNCVVEQPDFGGIDSLDYNLISDSSCFEDGQEGANDQLGIDPLLEDLANNGGPTQTHAIDETSPAHDAIPEEDCATEHDQRGVERPQGDMCDIGAFELEMIAPPTLDLPTEPVVVEATGPDGATVDFADQVSAEDSEGNVLTVTCDPASGDTFPIGDTTVECEATDSTSNETTGGSFTVRVQDTTPPAVTIPDDMTVPASGPDGATVDLGVTATDLVDPDPTIDCQPPSGSLFPAGEHTVTCTATDDEGNESAPQSFTVTVLGAGDLFLALIQDVGSTEMPRVKQFTIQLFLLIAWRAQDESPALSCAMLEVAAERVENYTPRHIDEMDAERFLASIEQIRAVLGC